MIRELWQQHRQHPSRVCATRRAATQHQPTSPPAPFCLLTASPLAIRPIDHRFASVVALGGRRAVGVQLLCRQRGREHLDPDARAPEAAWAVRQRARSHRLRDRQPTARAVQIRVGHAHGQPRRERHPVIGALLAPSLRSLQPRGSSPPFSRPPARISARHNDQSLKYASARPPRSVSPLTRARIASGAPCQRSTATPALPPARCATRPDPPQLIPRPSTANEI